MYQLTVHLADVVYDRDDLKHWNEKKKRDRATALVERALSAKRTLPFGQLTTAELRDVVQRGAERFTPFPDRGLDLHWTARRGILTYYAPFELGIQGKEYFTFDSIGSLGEGVALYVLEDWIASPPDFGYVLMCRPLGDSPDLVMRHRERFDEYGLVEAKATEKEDVEPELRNATTTLLDILLHWKEFNDLRSTTAFAVATSFGTQGEFNTTVVRLRQQ